MIKKQRNLDGIKCPVYRNGAWKNVCFSDLCKAEMKEVLKNKDKQDCISMIDQLQADIRALAEGLLKDEYVRQLTMAYGFLLYRIGEFFDVGEAEDNE